MGEKESCTYIPKIFLGGRGGGKVTVRKVALLEEHTALNVASGCCTLIYGLVLIHSCPEMGLDFLCAR